MWENISQKDFYSFWHSGKDNSFLLLLLKLAACCGTGGLIMNTDSKSYKKYAKKHMAKSPIFKNCICAFLVGGFICAFAEGLYHLYLFWKIPEDTVKSLVPVTLVFLAAFLTGIGVFDDIARFAGAGTLVPITGFANAMAAPAIDDKSEGFIMGVGVKMFTIAGPVIVYGVLTSVLYGVIYWIWGLFV